MAGELLLINPRKRRASKKRRVRARARNPIAKRVHHKVHKLSTHRRRRRNPIASSRTTAGVSAMLKQALVAGAGSVAVDAVMGQVRPMLPESVQTGYAYAGTKALITIGLGILGKKALGQKAVTMAEGALTVQMANIITSFVPTSMTMGGRSRILGPSGGMRGMGYFTPGAMLPGRVNQQLKSPQVLGHGMNGVGYFTRQGGSGNTVRSREGVNVR